MKHLLGQCFSHDRFGSFQISFNGNAESMIKANICAWIWKQRSMHNTINRVCRKVISDFVIVCTKFWLAQIKILAGSLAWNKFHSIQIFIVRSKHRRISIIVPTFKFSVESTIRRWFFLGIQWEMGHHLNKYGVQCPHNQISSCSKLKIQYIALEVPTRLSVSHPYQWGIRDRITRCVHQNWAYNAGLSARVVVPFSKPVFVVFPYLTGANVQCACAWILNQMISPVGDKRGPTFPRKLKVNLLRFWL